MPPPTPSPPHDSLLTGGDSGLATDVFVTRWQAGDQEAFEALYHRFEPLLELRVRRSRVWPLLRGFASIHDVVQEVWSRIVTAAGSRFEPSGPGSFLAFLRKVCDRTMISLVRHHRAQKRGDGRAHADLDSTAPGDLRARPGQAEEPTPTSVARTNELLGLAEQLLSEREHMAWQLVELKEYTADEAGLAMRCSGSAVRGLLLRARTKIVMRLDPDAQNGRA